MKAWHYVLIGACIFLALAIDFMKIEPIGESKMNISVVGDAGGDDTMNKSEIVVLETSKGNIEIELDRKNALKTVDNFLRYTKEKHYDGTVFHRVMNGFMIQGGGFLPDGTQKPTHEPISLESRNGLKNTRGTVAMARTMIPDSATSQFFINVVDNPFLDYSPKNDGYAVFGRVTSGMGVVDQIVSVKTGTRGMNENWPVEDVLIKRAYLK
jgi:peptidyl-prolyl cis-trans isomerase A (cyclophilin A)